VVDVYFLAQLHDAGQRSLPGLGLKEVARHFGLARPDRTYLEGPEIGRVFARDPARVLAYLRDDVRETQGLADLLEPVYFAQAQVLPFGFQNVCVRGNAAKIDALLLRAYRHAGRAVARPDPPRPFEGGYTDIFERGVIRNVHHCDVRSLYPSLMLARRIGPASDDLGAFLELLRYLRDRRLAAKERARRAASPEDRRNEDARQGTLKILINSFYGYLGFSAARFSDFSAAERVTAAGREVLRHMVEWIRGHGGRPVEIDTDGVYFVPPDESAPGAREAFRRELAASLPEGIEVEFDGEYESMFSYRMKNYALLAPGGEVLLRGAALRSRGLEPFQRDYMREAIGLLLRGREAELPGLRRRYRGDIEQRRWPVARLAKTERLQDAPETYRGKVGAKGRGRNAAYELALASGRPYRAGDTLSYYVSGTRKSVAVFEAAKLVSAWDPAARDENVAYYAAKLEALANKFEAMVHPGDDPAQGQLDLGEGGRAGGDGEGGGDEA
jgi:DNA polymerase elongation subunit (family B)